MVYGETMPDNVERVATAIVDAAIRVHRLVGPGLLESVYTGCLAHELRGRGFRVDREVPVPISYGGVMLDEGFKIDLLVEQLVIVQLKAVQEMHPVFRPMSHVRPPRRQAARLFKQLQRLASEGRHQADCKLMPSLFSYSHLRAFVSPR